LGKFRHTSLGLAVLALSLAPLANLRASGGDDLTDDIEFEEPDIELPEVVEPALEEPEFDAPEVAEPEVAEPEVEEPEVEEPEVEEVEVEEVEVEEPEVAETEVEETEVEETDVEETEVDETEVDETEVDETEVDETEVDETETEEPSAQEPEDTDTPDALSPAEQDGSDDQSAASPAAEQQAAEDWLANLVQTQNPEFDVEGNPVRRGEIVALDLAADASEELARSGFVEIEVSALPALAANLTILRAPQGRSAGDALALARTLDPAGIYDFGHYYASVYEPSTGRAVAAATLSPVHAVAGNLRIGLIDTDVRQADLPRRIAVQSRAFGRAAAHANTDHGTAVASILVANGAGELVVANVFDENGRREYTSAQTIGEALSWMLERQVMVINVSLAGPRNAVLDALVRRVIARGAVVVAAAGNGGPAAPPAYPAALPDVIAVTAVDASQRIYRYANRGDYVRIAAYGVRVPVDMQGDAASVFSGTSFAAPRVSALIADCITSGTRRDACIRRMESSAQDLGVPGRDVIYGFGFVD